MSCVHYKFFSKLDYSTVTFHGLYITLRELKKQIMARERLKATKGDLQISNAETSEEYTDDEAQIPSLSSVIVRRIPLGGVKPAGKTFIVHRSSKAVVRSPRPDKSVEVPKPVRKTKGIPQSFMVKAEPGTKGAMLTSTGEHVIPAIDAEAYARGKKECPPFVPHDQSSSEDEADPIPEELLCPICTDLLTDAVVIPCCGSSYCNDCIRTFLLDSEEHTCFTCQQSGVSPDNLISNNFLRQVVNRFRNDTPNTKLVRKQVQQAALPPPRLQMSRPLHSRQQDPLLANVTHPSPAIVPTAAPRTQVQPPAPSPPAPVTDQHSPMDSTSQCEPHSPGELDPEHTGIRSPESSPDFEPNGYHLSVIDLPPPIRPPHPSGHLSRPHNSQGGGDRHWERCYTGRDPRLAHIYMAPPSPEYPSPYLYPPSSEPYPPPYTSGLLLPPPFGDPPQPIYAPGSPGLNPPFIPPGVQPPLSKKYCYKQRRRQDKTTPDEFRSRSRIPSRSRPRSPSNRGSNPRSAYSRHNGRSYGRSRSRSPPPLRAGPWEGAEGPAPFRSRYHSPGGFRNRSPGGRQPPPRGLPPYKLKGPSRGSHDRLERERHRQWEMEYKDCYKKPCKDYDNQHPSLHHRGRGSRDRKRDSMSPSPRDYFLLGRGKRAREERGAPPHHPPSSSSSGTKSSTKVLKTKTVKKKRPREEPDPSHHSADRCDATPLRDELIDEIPTINNTPPISSKLASDSGVAKAPTSKSPAAPAKPSNKTVSKTKSDKTRKEKAREVKPKGKTEAVKTEAMKTEAIKKKDSNRVETNKANPEDHIDQPSPKRKRVQ